MNKKSILALAMMVLLLTVSVGGTIAYLAASTEPVVNIFTPGELKNKVEEEFDFDTKKNVKISNTGTVDAYVRAAVIVTWKDPDGNVYGKLPVAGTDYQMVMGESTKWTVKQEDGFYYYKGAVAAGKATDTLISQCIQLVEAPDGYSLSVEIISNSVQAEPDTAVKELWGETAAGLVKE